MDVVRYAPGARGITLLPVTSSDVSSFSRKMDKVLEMDLIGVIGLTV